MKSIFSIKSMFTILLVFSFSTITNAQLVYDFSKGEFQNKPSSFNKAKGRVTPIPYGGFARMQIININTFRYKVELAGNSVNFVTPIPSELQRVFRLSSENVSDQNITKALGLANSAADEMNQQLENLKEAKQKNPAAFAAAPVSKAAENLEKALKDLVETCAEYIEIAKKVANIKFTRMQLITLSTLQWKTHNSLLEVLPAQLSQAQMKKDYESFQTYYARAYLLYEKAVSAAKEAKDQGVQIDGDTQSTIENAKEQIEQSRNLFLQDDFIKLIEDVTVLQDALANPQYFEVTSAPIQVNGDYVNFNVNITPAPVNALLPFDIARTFPVEIPAKGGLKVDFSVGPAVSFGNSSKDQVYYLETLANNPDEVMLKKRRNNNKISPGIAAMMHAGPRSGTETRFAGMFGVGAGFQGTEDVNLSLYGGASVVFGKMERVMVSTGVSFLKVERLKKNEFIIDKQYATADINLSDVTEKVFKPSFFIALSYNLTNRLDVK